MSKHTPEPRDYTFSPTGIRISTGYASVCQNCLAHIKEIEKLRADKARLIEALKKCLKDMEDDAESLDGEFGTGKTVDELIATNSMHYSYDEAKQLLTEMEQK